jgi:hypothetical protein
MDQLRRTDDSLYQGKRTGLNKVIIKTALANSAAENIACFLVRREDLSVERNDTDQFAGNKNRFGPSQAMGCWDYSAPLKAPG